MDESIHAHLARHLSMMGLPLTDGLVDILKENFSQTEAKIALLLPATHIPLTPVTPKELAQKAGLNPDEVRDILEGLAKRKLIFSGLTETEERGYALHQAGFGFPQSFFWDGKKSPFALKMTSLVIKYFSRQVTRDAFGGTKTKAYRYIPVHQSLKPEVQTVLPHDRMDQMLDGATRFAVAHCPCRVQAGLMDRACSHPLEVCLKFDEMAAYLIEQGLGREITRQEAGNIVRDAAKAGLVHFVDNAAGKIKHNCNCCGCSCWNVGMIRRRKIPRDELMAVYFIRETDPELCIGCGACQEICPVAAITIENGLARVDEVWCIGCGVCALKCDMDALRVIYRKDIKPVPKDFKTLHTAIQKERESVQGEKIF